MMGAAYRVGRWILGGVLAVSVASCGGKLGKAIDKVMPGSEPVYKSSKSTAPLEVPPDLSSSTISDSHVIPGGSVSGTTYSDYTRERSDTRRAGVAGVLPAIPNVHMERSGNERWLVVKAPPAQIWPRVRDFWLSQGFLIKVEDPSIGIMETDWAEKRADLDRGLIGSLMSKLSSTLAGAAVRDKFRTRLERGNAPDTTEIYVSHRGAKLVTTVIDKKRGDESRTWEPRPADPDLEAEMLQRMMVSFGIEQQRARQVVAKAKPRAQRARLVRDNQGAAVLSVRERFARAWRRTGLALDRVGFTVQDRDRSRGLYYVRYLDPDRAGGKKEKGFFSKLKFWGDSKPAKGGDEYLISLTDSQGTTQIVVLNKQGKRVTSSTADRILALLEKQLR